MAVESGAPSRFERMLVTGARDVRDGSVLFVGFHWPFVIARIARRLHAPNLVIVYENGIVEDHLTPIVPTSPCDLTAAERATMCSDSMAMLYMLLGNDRLDGTLLEAPIVDRFGNVNTTAIGDYLQPRVRLPGSGGGTELGSLARNLMLICPYDNRRAFPERVDYVTSPGYLGGRAEREALGYATGSGPATLVTPLGRFTFDERGEMELAGRHPGVDDTAIGGGFGWEMRVRRDCVCLPEPTADELRVCREELRAAADRRYALPS
ncbi:MAG: CoA-transferase subunit beta [Chloroflexi bacterium]|nr:CoA-transferase subunit beta [Chloroflexota bacterium]